MRIPRIYVDATLTPGARCVLDARASEHLVRVLRLGLDHPLRLFDGHGREYTARLASLRKDAASADVDAAIEVTAPESPLALTLAQGIARGDRMDLVLQKATELGVAAFQPLHTERTEVRLDAIREARRMTHWHGVIVHACEQCGRARLPALAAPQALPAWAAGTAQGELRLALDPAGALGLDDLPAEARSMVLVIGPEGGLAERELALLRQAGFRGLRLGPRILRTETAGLAAIAALQARFGDLR